MAITVTVSHLHSFIAVQGHQIVQFAVFTLLPEVNLTVSAEKGLLRAAGDPLRVSHDLRQRRVAAGVAGSDIGFNLNSGLGFWRGNSVILLGRGTGA